MRETHPLHGGWELVQGCRFGLFIILILKFWYFLPVDDASRAHTSLRPNDAVASRKMYIWRCARVECIFPRLAIDREQHLISLRANGTVGKTRLFNPYRTPEAKRGVVRAHETNVSTLYTRPVHPYMNQPRLEGDGMHCRPTLPSDAPRLWGREVRFLPLMRLGTWSLGGCVIFIN